MECNLSSVKQGINLIALIEGGVRNLNWVNSC